MADDTNYEFEAFMEEVGDILSLSTQNPQSLQKSKAYLETKIQLLEMGKQKFFTYNQVKQINLLVNEIRDIKDRLQVQN